MNIFKSTLYKLANKLDIFQHANKITNNIWLGNIFSALDNNFIIKNNIQVIINCTNNIPFTNLSNITKYRIGVNDKYDINEFIKMSVYLEKITNIIKIYEKKNINILIHCMAGAQRSATILAGFLIKYHNFSTKNAIKYIHNKRTLAFFPHITFKIVLKNFEQKQKKISFIK